MERRNGDGPVNRRPMRAPLRVTVCSRRMSRSSVLSENASLGLLAVGHRGWCVLVPQLVSSVNAGGWAPARFSFNRN